MPHRSLVSSSPLLANREVPANVSLKQMRQEIPYNWKDDDVLWGYMNQFKISASGAGFISPPYTAFWDRIWGATPVEDLPKYKDLYNFTPYIKASIDVTVNLTLSNGFELEGSTAEIRQWLTDWLDEHDFLQTARITLTDELVFGNGEFEICRDKDQNGIIITPPEEWWLKSLDPVHIRVRRDQYGNIFGYIQLLTFPPVAFPAQDIVHYKYGAKSWWYEYSYGTSLLRPLLLIQAYIDSFQRDMATIMAVYTKPMLVIKAGTPERPFTDPQREALQETFAKRGPATDVVVRGDIDVSSMQSMTRQINVDWWIKYLHDQRQAVLGVPKIFLGESEGTNRATADIVMQEYVSRLRMLQENFGDTTETRLFKELVDAKFGEGKEIPHIKWRPIWEPSLAEKAKLLADLVGRNIIARSEARAQLGFAEALPADLKKNQVTTPPVPTEEKQ